MDRLPTNTDGVSVLVADDATDEDVDELRAQHAVDEPTPTPKKRAAAKRR